MSLYLNVLLAFAAFAVFSANADEIKPLPTSVHPPRLPSSRETSHQVSREIKTSGEKSPVASQEKVVSVSSKETTHEAANVDDEAATELAKERAAKEEETQKEESLVAIHNTEEIAAGTPASGEQPTPLEEESPVHHLLDAHTDRHYEEDSPAINKTIATEDKSNIKEGKSKANEQDKSIAANKSQEHQDTHIIDTLPAPEQLNQELRNNVHGVSEEHHSVENKSETKMIEPEATPINNSLENKA